MKSATTSTHVQPINANTRKTTQWIGSPVLSATDNLTRNSTIQPTTGMSIRIAFTSVVCELNHLSKVITNLLKILFKLSLYILYLLYNLKMPNVNIFLIKLFIKKQKIIFFHPFFRAFAIVLAREEYFSFLPRRFALAFYKFS